MTRFLPLLIGIASVVSSCSKNSPVERRAEQTVTKNVAFEIYADKDYTSSFYDNTLAEVKLSIATLNLKNNTSTIIWDTAYDFRQLKQYPQFIQKIRIEKTAQHLESSELLHISKVVRYNTNGQMSMQASGEGMTSTSKLFVVPL